ncbi:MAG: hypothetical protein D3920_10665, partial [Candidatus Electrothrix sp. AW2]|nr:hypothetical protein [Candidatus Electrothrix gigas]
MWGAGLIYYDENGSNISGIWARPHYWTAVDYVVWPFDYLDDPLLYIQCGCPCAHTGSTANMSSGNLFNSFNLFNAQGGTLPLAFTLFHNSLDSYDGVLGPKWTHSYNISLDNSGNDVGVIKSAVFDTLRRSFYIIPILFPVPVCTINSQGEHDPGIFRC